MMLGWELPPHNSGGLGTACFQLCRSLSKKKVDIEFILPYQAEHDVDFMSVTAARPLDVAEIRKAGLAYDSHRYITFDGKDMPLDLYDQQRVYEHAVARMAADREFDIVHAHDWLTFRAALKVKAIKNCPVILHVHSVESDRAGNKHGNPLVREIEELSLHMADRVIAVSKYTKAAIVRDYGVPAEKIEVVHNSLDSSDMPELDDENAYRYLALMKSLGYRVVVNVGRLTIQKGLPNLLLAAKRVIDHAPKTLFLIVGSGEQYHELIELSAGLGIGDKVLFAAFQRGKNWRDAFAIGDLFVLPSVSEPFGLTPLEATFYGTPSLVSKQSGISEVMNNCLKVDFWDVDEMANKIAAVMLNDPLRDELVRSAIRESVNLSWENASEKIIDLYRTHAVGAAA
jgi:glycogen(starch) synthase